MCCPVIYTVWKKNPIAHFVTFRSKISASMDKNKHRYYISPHRINHLIIAKT